MKGKGTVFNPLEVKEGFRVHFQYDADTYFEVYLNTDNSLTVRVSGLHSDLLAIHCHVSNHALMVARRWNTDTARHEDYLKPEGAA